MLFALKPESILKQPDVNGSDITGSPIPRVWVWSSSEFPNPLLKPREERIPSHARRRQRKSVDRRLCTVGKQSSSLSRLLIEAAVAEAELWPLVMVHLH
ncbi:hypothetical protein OPV22_001867 [Ensete ventricosum]|uniref:Uncharacterized protein n=1 Tax=Ensete ventricosum TaxID=4639 RepID=A0AAV8RVA5_ENSVE|nr:hypothetical protein OPV22_001867 [Ensete ventricosum]